MFDNRRRTTRRFARGIAAVAVAAAVAGCAALGGGGPPPATYDLSAPVSFPGLRAGTSAQILIQEPAALKALDSERIVVKPSVSAVEYMAKAQWSDRLPKLVQTRLLQAFENTGRVRAVGRPGEGLLIDYQIVSDIRAFELSLAGAATAVVEISGKIVNDRNGRVVAVRLFTAQVPAAGASADAAVAALDRALEEVLVDFVAWTLGRI
ncbi:MAG: membrane integrity-associated transporter subunit PqiC [Hyphomicrobiales bacterium]|nr:membrane integrity-associated transporter subunit PqiC [Hyphomicrobiales bacterium]